MSRTAARWLALTASCATVAACHHGPSPAGQAAARAATGARQPSGDALAYRFVDHAGAATRSGPSLGAAWNRLAYPAKLVSPYSGLRGDAAYRVAELSLADADVEHYGRAGGGSARPVAYDPVWNRTRAVYESKLGLFAPAGTRYDFALPPLGRSRLRLALAAPPGSAAVDATVLVDGKSVFARRLAAADAGRWSYAEIELADAQALSFVTEGAGVAFWGDPVLIAPSAGAAGPNVMVVIIDTLRADAVAVMPNLRGLAAEGAWFEQAITAATWTRPSLLALLGGDLPTALGQSAEAMIPAEPDRQRFYAVAPPLLRRLAADGYRASAIGNNFFLLGYPQIGLDFGFEEVADVRHPQLDTPAITAATERYLEQHAREAFYLQVHYDGPHWPYTPPPEQLAKIEPPPGFPDDAMARAYLAEAAYADEHLGQLLATLDRLQLRERTIVVVVGDHGEIFDHAHDQLVEALHQPTLHHHGWSAYDGILRVPLAIAWRGQIPAHTRVAAQVSLVDVAPTLLGLLGRPPTHGRGRSLAAYWKGEAAASRAAFVEGQNVRALRDEGWAYLRRGDGRLTLPGGGRVRVDEELYDLTADPAQHFNRVADSPARLAKMRAQFDALAPQMPDAPAELVHLRLAPGPAGRLLEGVIRSDAAITVHGVEQGRVTPIDGRQLAIQLRARGGLDFELAPGSARLELTLKRDGQPLPAGQLLVGEFGLPLLAGVGRAWFDLERLPWLDAHRSPPLGDHGDVLVWRDAVAAPRATVVARAGESSDEVAGMMRRWGYSQPDK